MARIPLLPAEAAAAAQHELKLLMEWIHEGYEHIETAREAVRDLDEHMLVCDCCRSGANTSHAWMARMSMARTIGRGEQKVSHLYERMTELETELGIEAN